MDTGAIVPVLEELGRWRWGDETFRKRFAEGSVYFDDSRVYMKERASDTIEKYPEAVLDQFLNTSGTNELKALFSDRVFPFPKPVSLIDYLLRIATAPDSLILDFFSGSATTAHAVMQLNAEDGGKRKYICVQLPEATPGGSEARKAGYATIPDIAKERIRRAGQKIKDELWLEHIRIEGAFDKFAFGDDVDKDVELWNYIHDEATRNEAQQKLSDLRRRIDSLDTGFRVLRLDSTNRQEVFFAPGEMTQASLFDQVDSLKGDRTELDLLFGCMVDWGVELSLPLRTEVVADKRLHIVSDGALVACFDRELSLEALRAIAQMKPLRVIFRESCFATDADKLNVYELFKQLCGWSSDETYKRIHVL